MPQIGHVPGAGRTTSGCIGQTYSAAAGAPTLPAGSRNQRSGSARNRSAHRSLQLSYLSQANYRNYIVAAVPAGDQVYHKVGINDDTLNDAAIIKQGDKYVVLVIFTNGNGNYDLDHRGQLTQDITRQATAAYL